MSGRPVRWSGKILLALGTVLAWLLLAEGILRVVWEQPWYERLIAEQGQSLSLTYEKNRWGLRDDEPQVPRPPDRLRVLALGDSFTFGMGVADREATFPELLEDRLGGLRPDIVGGVEVLNGGLPGSLTRDWVDLWDEVARQYQPDVLLIVFFVRDGTTAGSIPGFFDRIRERIARRNEESWLRRTSCLVRFVQDVADRRRIATGYAGRLATGYFGTGPETAEWRRAQQNLRKLDRRARQLGTRVGFVVFPVLVELGAGHPFVRQHELLVDFARALGWPTLDLLPAFRGRNAPDLWVSAFDQHPNAEGHRIAADALLPFVVDLLPAPEAGN